MRAMGHLNPCGAGFVFLVSPGSSRARNGGNGRTEGVKKGNPARLLIPNAFPMVIAFTWQGNSVWL